VDGQLRTKARFDGELLIDNRGSPGLPAAFIDAARALGFDPINPAEGKIAEVKTMTCAHCGSVVILRPERVRPRGYCRSCDRYICDACAGAAAAPGYLHLPFKKVVDDLREDTFRRESGYAPLTTETPLVLKGT
jgi:hypothetical protein